MSVLISSQQPGWHTNIYVLTTTRILVGMGVLYIIRSLIQLVQWSRTSNDHFQRSALAEADIGIDLEDVAGDAIHLFSTTTNAEDVVEIRLPQPVHQPQSAIHMLRDTPLRRSAPIDLPLFELEARGQMIDNGNLHSHE